MPDRFRCWCCNKNDDNDEDDDDDDDDGDAIMLTIIESNNFDKFIPQNRNFLNTIDICVSHQPRMRININ